MIHALYSTFPNLFLFQSWMVIDKILVKLLECVPPPVVKRSVATVGFFKKLGQASACHQALPEITIPLQHIQSPPIHLLVP